MYIRLLIFLLTLSFDQDWQNRDWTEAEYQQELKRLLETEEAIRGDIRREAGLLLQEADRLKAVDAEKQSVQNRIAELDRRIEGQEMSFAHRKRHYIETAELTRDVIQKLEDDILKTDPDQRAPLFERLDERKKYLKKLEDRIETLRESSGTAQRVERFRKAKVPLLKQLDDAVKALQKQELAVAHKQADVDRHADRLDEAIGNRMKFESLAAELLASAAPPILRSVKVQAADGSNVFYEMIWTDPEDREDETRKALRLCESMMFQKRQHIREAERESRNAQLDFIGVDAELQHLYQQYESRVYNQGYANIGIELADSADTIFVGTGGNPALIAATSLTELAFRLKEVGEYVLLDVKPSFRDFPEISEITFGNGG